MAANDDILQLYLGVLNGTNTLQDFVDSISNKIENNRVRSHLQTFLRKTEELEQFYNIQNQYCSPRFGLQSGIVDEQGEPVLFDYYVQKMPDAKHFCLYISIPANHPLYGKNYDEVPDATFSSADEAEPNRWVFGWDYAHYKMLTLASIFLHYSINSDEIVDLEIITIDKIENDVSRYAHILAGSP
jgi:hypothetical protein